MIRIAGTVPQQGLACGAVALAVALWPDPARAASLADKLGIVPPQAAIEASDFEVATPERGNSASATSAAPSSLWIPTSRPRLCQAS
jgi:hypothetical protein